MRNNSGLYELSLDEVARFAPSVFAQEAHESRSARYSYIPTAQVLSGLMREGFRPFQAFQGKSRIEGKAAFTKHTIRLRHPDLQVRVDGLFPEIVLRNSHDGTSSYQLMLGFFRLICSNGMVVADSIVEKQKVLHKGNVEREVIEGAYRVIDSAAAISDQVAEWNETPIEYEEQLFLADKAHKARFGKVETDDYGNKHLVVDTPIQPRQMLIPHRREDMSQGQTPSLYLVQNVIQENVIRGGQTGYSRDERGRSRRTTTRGINEGSDQAFKLNAILWEITDHFAKARKAA